MSVGAMGVFNRRLLLAVDARGYGSADTARQRDIQTVLPRLLADAAEAAGLDRETWVRQPGGDSEFAVLPAGSDEQALVEPFMRRLDAGLRAHNRDRVPGARLALRVAVHFGPASEAPSGFVGPGPVEVSRILEGDPLRRALAAAPEAALVVALTAPVFTELVAQGYTNFRPEEFREVLVEKKEYRGRAWLWVPGHDVHRLDLGDHGRDGGHSAAEPAGPVEPAGPADPTGPVEPAGPADPTGPVEPAGSTGPVEPAGNARAAAVAGPAKTAEAAGAPGTAEGPVINKIVNNHIHAPLHTDGNIVFGFSD